MPPDPLPKRGFPTGAPPPPPVVQDTPPSPPPAPWLDRQFARSVADARLDRIASKVDAGEPVSVEPGGYRLLTQADLYEVLRPRTPLRFDDLDDWSAGDPDPGFGRPPDIPDSWRWTTLGLLVAALAVWRWRHGR